MDWLKLVHGSGTPKPPAEFKVGDEIRVWYRIMEQGKERLGQFEGIVIRYRGSGHAKTFTVRRVTYGEGVERVFPLDAKAISRIELLRQGKVKRSRLYYLRTVIGKTRIEAAGDSSAEKGAVEKAEGDLPVAGAAPRA
ncbi:MAG: 50S ribosomal protein L19 [Candidatus Omnitrophica bacterium]|nr:50S ribosomal protein L19 [Candidatus Omnitrophota bacterium]